MKLMFGQFRSASLTGKTRECISLPTNDIGDVTSVPGKYIPWTAVSSSFQMAFRSRPEIWTGRIGLNKHNYKTFFLLSWPKSFLCGLGRKAKKSNAISCLCRGKLQRHSEADYKRGLVHFALLTGLCTMQPMGFCKALPIKRRVEPSISI